MKKYITILLTALCLSSFFVKEEDNKNITYDRYSFIGGQHSCRPRDYFIDEDYEFDELTASYIGIMTNNQYDASNFHDLAQEYCEGIINRNLIKI